MEVQRVLFVLSLLLFLVHHGNAQIYRVCAREGNSPECQGLERGSSNVACTKVTDSVDCSLKIMDGKADFTIMTAEEIILSTLIKSDKFDVIASVRHEDKREQKYAFQSVVLVKANHVGGLSGLAGGRLCHPGFGKAREQLWSDRVLKYFEKKTTSGSRKCSPESKSSAEDDVLDLSQFFSDACRPGPWLPDSIEDKKLKQKFPSLCSLCTSNRTPDCDGYRYFEPRASPGMGVNSHLSAIECVKSGKGTVAYVAYAHVLNYFKNDQTEMNDYALLCENGTTVPLSLNSQNEAPCAWVHQPWSALVARKEVSKELFKEFKSWMPSGRPNDLSTGQSWITGLYAILLNKNPGVFEYPLNVVPPSTYITQGRPLPKTTESCHKALRWCTISDEEQNKCLWVKTASLTLGLQPEIACIKGTSPLDCLSLIKQDRADFISIDSNLGFLARKHYNVTAVLYHETSRSSTSKVYAIIKDADKDTITRFENLRDKNVCFPEYGGIGWITFMRTAQERRVITTKQCDYANEIMHFFKAACAPGASDPGHYPSKAVDPSKLCTACKGFSNGNNEQGVVNMSPPSPNKACPADISNKYYGDRGALLCLSEPESHVAFLEGQNIEEYAANLSLNPNQFRILCRNGSLAQNPGFKVDDNCALSTTINSEVVARRNDKKNLDIQLYLQDLDVWFGYGARRTQLVDFEIFSPFYDEEDLLFKDSTVGLAKSDSENELVTNYIDLFKHTESCTGAASSISLSSIVLTLSILYYLLNIKNTDL